MIKRAWLQRYDQLPNVDPSAVVIQSWDPATKGGDRSDYSVCTTWLYQDKRYYLIDVFRGRLDFPALKAQALSLAQLHNPQIILVEDAGVGDALAKELNEARLPAIAIKPEGDKRTRMAIQSIKFESGQVFLPSEAPWLDSLEAELFSFPGSRHDDQVDSISQALAYEITVSEWTDEALEGFARLTGGPIYFYRR
jgi:predicted phage terminase large subunit-like protein